MSSQWIVAGHGVRLAVMRVWRTREFDQQIGRHAFGSIALSIEF
ncbi:MAG: lipid A deacylase LpxR family protein [Rhodocyclaceae bacterium]|nr:lipid A deacylase LpxR family protein [Rhodocyclaceae bacterium]